MSSGKWQPSCLGLNELTNCIFAVLIEPYTECIGMPLAGYEKDVYFCDILIF